MQQISDTKLEQAKRLAWVMLWAMFDPDNPDDVSLVKKYQGIDDRWESITPGVKQKTIDKLAFIIDGDDEAYASHPDRFTTEEDWERHRQWHETHA